MEVTPYGDGSQKKIRQKGFCMQKSMEVDFGAECVMGTCWTERSPHTISKTPIHKLRAKKAAERRKRLNEEKIKMNIRSKGIDEY